MAASDLPDLDISLSALRQAPLQLLVGEGELELLRVLAQWPRQVALAARSHEPHRIAFYLYDLAGALHALWAQGKQQPSLRFVNDKDPKMSLARLALVAGVRQVLALGLKLLGVSAPQELELS